MRRFPPPPTPTRTPTRVTERQAALVSGFLSAVGLAPSLTTLTTPAPAPATFVWTVLAFVRREIEQVQRTYLNRTPDAVDDTVRTSEDTFVSFDPLANDVDPERGDVKTITSYTQPTNGTVARNAAGGFTYTPASSAQALAAGEQLTDSFTYTITDESSAAHVHGLRGLLSGGGHTDTATVNITITGVNDAPTAAADSFTTRIRSPRPQSRILTRLGQAKTIRSSSACWPTTPTLRERR